MDRRAFFRSAIDKGSKPIVKAVDASIKKQASHWIRPPYALDELEFILACTRCGDCIAACPHEVIFSLSARLGMKFAGTPALDLLNKGCHLCEDWPCVTACTPNALIKPEPVISETAENATEISSETNGETNKADPLLCAPPKLARASINEQTCLPYSGPECGACIGVCPIHGALTLDMCKPVINQSLCNGCGLCRESCIADPKAINIAAL